MFMRLKYHHGKLIMFHTSVPIMLTGPSLFQLALKAGLVFLSFMS